MHKIPESTQVRLLNHEPLDTSVGVILLGGQENALAVTRSLGRLGVRVCVIADPGCLALQSKYCVQALPTPKGVRFSEYCRDVLLDGTNEHLTGRIIFPCCDEAIQFVAEHDDALCGRYILEEAAPAQRRAMLDKKRTLEIARAAGVGAPQFWEIGPEGPPVDLITQVTFPVMVKPIVSHEFTPVFGCKLFIVEQGPRELEEKLSLAREHDIDVMVVEMIPGPDSLLSSYYTYINADGDALYHFTKRILRRYPENSGAACYHETKWLPETRDAGTQFFQKTNFRGMGNIEFKLDERDGQLKIIEVNARFTAAQVLANRAGAPLDVIVYAHLTGQPPPNFEKYQEGLRYWYPVRDFKAYRELKKKGRLSFLQWVRSLFGKPRVNPFFAWDDLQPVAAASAVFLRKQFKG